MLDGYDQGKTRLPDVSEEPTRSVRELRTSRAAYLEQRSARVMRTLEHALANAPELYGRVATVVGELLVELRRVEAARRESEREAAALRERRNDLLERIPLPCLLTRDDGTILELNRAAALLLNAPRSGAVGRTVTLFFKDRPEAAGLLRQAVDSGAPVHGTLHVMPRNQRARAIDISISTVAGVATPEWRWFLRHDATEQ